MTIHIFSWDNLPVEASNVASESKKHKQQNEISNDGEIIKDNKDENEKRGGDKNTDRKKDHEHSRKTTRSPKKKDNETSKEEKDESQVPNLRSRNDDDDDILKMLTDQILQVNFLKLFYLITKLF